MPPHEGYIETHLGGGAVMRNKRAARSNIGIEIDPEVVEMWTKVHPIGFELVHDDAINYLNMNTVLLMPITEKRQDYWD